MEEIRNRINAAAEKIYEELVLLRRTIHADPELSNEEYRTAELVETTLKKWHIGYTRLSGSTAIVAEIKGDLPGENSIGLRADMDALPVEETADVAYASKNKGVMHACGHDIHTVNLLGTGYVLLQLKDCFAGTVKLVFQPAEEIGGGAQEILDFGVLENPRVTAFLAAHVAEDVEVGRVQVKAGETTMAASRFTIRLSGQGGHAAAPHLTGDIILAAAKIILELQSIPGRKINHLEPAVITVASIHSGTRNNIIPKELVMSGTIRTQNNDLHPVIHRHIREILEGQERITGIKGTLSFRLGSGAAYNDPALTENFIQAAGAILGKEHVLLAKFPNNWSENFCLFTKKVPSVFFRLGVSRNVSQAEPLHSAAFKADDEALKTGVRVMTAAALEFLRKGGLSV